MTTPDPIAPLQSASIRESTLDKKPPLSLDSVLQEIEQWKSQKSSFNEPLPDVIWKNIFTLSEHYSVKRVCSFLGIGITRYNKKFHQFYPSQKHTTTKKSEVTQKSDRPPVDFCEVKTKNPIFEPLQIPTNTVIVEFRRADGNIMKIHCLSDRFHEIIQAFFAGDTHAANHTQT